MNIQYVPLLYLSLNQLVKDIAFSQPARGGLFTDLSIYGGTSADHSKISKILGGNVLDCSPVKAINNQKFGIDPNLVAN